MDKATLGVLATTRGGLGKALTPTWLNDHIPVYQTASDTWVMEAKPSGGGGTPSDTVVSETSYGQSTAAGTETTYSRGDHTHGTPVATRKWYLADEGSWIGRYPHLIYGSWTRQNNGNPILPVHGNWTQIYDGCWLWDNNEKVFYIWYGGWHTPSNSARIGYAKYDPAANTLTYLNNDNPVSVSGYVRYPSVIKDGSTYHLAYMRFSGSVWEGIFHAYSTDGINWTVDPTTPIVSTHYCPSWLRLGDSCYLLGGSIATPTTIGCFLGKGATRYTTVTAFSGNPILTGGGAGAWDEFLSNPFLYWCFGVFYLGYSGRPNMTPFSWKGGLSVSSSGWAYSKYPWNPNIEPGSSGKFDDAHVALRSIVRIEDKFHALYSGASPQTGSTWQLGYLTLE